MHMYRFFSIPKNLLTNRQFLSNVSLWKIFLQRNVKIGKATIFKHIGIDTFPGNYRKRHCKFEDFASKLFY